MNRLSHQMVLLSKGYHTKKKLYQKICQSKKKRKRKRKSTKAPKNKCYQKVTIHKHSELTDLNGNFFFFVKQTIFFWFSLILCPRQYKKRKTLATLRFTTDECGFFFGISNETFGGKWIFQSCAISTIVGFLLIFGWKFFNGFFFFWFNFKNTFYL